MSLDMETLSPNGLTLILGPANSGKLGRVLNWWESRLASHPLVVVPTGPDARSLSAEMAQRAGTLVGQSPATTFDGLVRLLLGRSPRYAGDFERSLLISQLLSDSPPQTPGFSARFPGVVAVVGSLLEQLGDSGRPPQEIEQALDRWASEDEDSALLAADIRELSAAYRGLRDRMGLSDRSDSLREALSAAGSWERPLALYGFTSFTLAQRRLITVLAQATEVVLVFDHERSRLRGLTSQSELAAWQALASHTVELTPQTLAYTSPAIAYLERHFMDDGHRPEPPPAWANGEGVRFLLASGQRNEAELAVAQVADLIRSGLRPGEVAVVVRHMRPWGRLLGDVFASCGIPCQVDERLTLDETGLGHAFLNGLRGVAEDDPSAVLKYLRSPFSGLTLEQASDLELDYLRKTARGVAALRGCAPPESRGPLDELVRVVGKRAEGAFVDLDAAQVVARRMLENGLRGSTADGAADARTFRALYDALSKLSLHQKQQKLPAGTLLAGVLLPALARMAVPAGPLGSEDAVQILTVHRARARRFQAVLILGLVEGAFPGRADRPALLTDDQRDRLDSIGGGLFSPEPDQEEALFVRAVSRAWKVLLLSARDADDGGGYAGQSYYWSHCKALLGVGEREHVHRTLADQVFELAGAPSLRQYLRACAAQGLEPHPACGLSSSSLPDWARPIGEAKLVSGQILDELAATQSLTPSALESYLRCPFAWFVEKVVGVEDMETVVDDRLLGQLLHKALSDTYLELRSAGVLPLGAQNLPFAETVAGAIVEALVDSESCPGTASERRLIEWQLKRFAANLFAMEAAAGGACTLDDTELKVGGKNGVDVGGLAIRGRIDRVDSTAGGELVVIDYKSGTIPDKGKIGTAEGLQLPLYMLALAEERPAQRVVGGMYLSPKKLTRAGVVMAGCEDVLGAETKACRVVEDDGLRQILDDAVELARGAAEGIRNGMIAPPVNHVCPSWCRLGPVCRAHRGSFRR
jgi:RecB family exonuclease